MKTIAATLILLASFVACDGWMNGHQRESLFVGVYYLEPLSNSIVFGIDFSGWCPTYSGTVNARFYWKGQSVWITTTTFQPGFHKTLGTGTPFGVHWDYCRIDVEVVHDGRIYNAWTDLRIIPLP